MMYQFTHLNGGATIDADTVEFISLVEWDLTTKIGSIKVRLTSGANQYETILEGVNLPTVNAGTIQAHGQLKLNEFKL